MRCYERFVSGNLFTSKHNLITAKPMQNTLECTTFLRGIELTFQAPGHPTFGPEFHAVFHWTTYPLVIYYEGALSNCKTGECTKGIIFD